MKGEDTMRTYVISVKRTKNYIGNQLTEGNQYWEYAQYDDHAGSFSTGYPCFGGETYAETFDSMLTIGLLWQFGNEYMKQKKNS